MSTKNAVCKTLESLLRAATGRQPRGSIFDVTHRLIKQIANKTVTGHLSSWHEATVLENDIEKLSDGIWSVLTSRGAELKLEIAGTIPGVSGRTSRFDFVCQYACDFFYETPVGHFRESSMADISDRFEEWLVAAALLFRTNSPENESFSIKSVYAGIRTHGKMFADTVSTEVISERLLAAFGRS